MTFQGFKLNAKECSFYGTYKCGVCECDDSHFGRKCECDSDNAHGTKDLTSGCRPDNFTQVDCSGRGSCVCGVCECEGRQNPDEVCSNFLQPDMVINFKFDFQHISGPFCECDNFSCDRHNGLLCAGADHGTCVCGKCQCAAGWTGKSCECKTSSDTCIPPGGGEICSGKGTCECGICKCFEDTEQGRYSGRYCEKCPVSRMKLLPRSGLQ